MRKIVLSEKDLVAAKAILREAYENGGLRAARDAIRSAYAHGGIKAARETAQTLVGPVGYLSVMVAALRDQETNHDA